MEYWSLLTSAIGNTVIVYLPAWAVGTMLGILLSFFIWSLPKPLSNRAYVIFAGVSFIPATILIPYFIRGFGLSIFVYPLLALPVMLITFASSYEAFQHANKHRLTLLVNYGMSKNIFFWSVVFREALPSMKTTTRQTLSLSFAIFIALDYFIEYWKGLGGMVQAYYSRLAFDQANHGYMLLTIGIAAVLGVGQVLLNDRVFNKLTEFRRHY